MYVVHHLMFCQEDKGRTEVVLQVVSDQCKDTEEGHKALISDPHQLYHLAVNGLIYWSRNVSYYSIYRYGCYAKI
jgi:hypothetical protein